MMKQQLMLISMCMVATLIMGCRRIVYLSPTSSAEQAQEVVVLGSVPEFGKVWVIPELELIMNPISQGVYHMPLRVGELVPLAVELSDPIWMGKYEVTQQQYQKIMGNNPSNFYGLKRPVDSVNWNDAQQFCLLLNVMENHKGRIPKGYRYRLPSELEWQYCAQAGVVNTPNPNLEKFAWFSGNSLGTSHEIGLKSPTHFDLYDLFGNLAEWCLDTEDEVIELTHIQSTKEHYFKALRGGSWYHDISVCSPDYRQYYDPASQDYFIGFRIVMAPDMGN